MAEFMLELYAARSDAAAVEARVERGRRAVAELTREGREVRFVRSIVLPDEETCFLLYEASSAELVREAARRAQLPFDHISEVAAGSA